MISMKQILFVVVLVVSLGATPARALPPEIELVLRLARVVEKIDAENYEDAKDDLSFILRIRRIS